MRKESLRCDGRNSKSSKRRAFFKERIPIYRKNPVLFAQEVLLFEPDPWQQEALMDLAEHPKVSIKSGQGVGKTGIEAVALLWFLTCFPFPRVVATAPTKQQLHDVLWSEVSKWQERAPLLQEILKWTKTYIYMKGHEKRWFATARTATKPENMQGFHEDNMLFIIDEASGVADPIMEAILGTLSGGNNKLLMCGNPTRTSGTFYDAFYSSRRMYKCHTVSSEDSPRTNKDNIKTLVDRFGYDSNVVRVRVRGLFPKQEDDVFIALQLLDAAIELEIDMEEENEEYTPDRIDIGVDVARFGNDNTVIAQKIDKVIPDLLVRHGQDTMKTAGDIVRMYRSLLEKYPKYDNYIYVKIDDTGVGGGVSDRLKELQSDPEEKLEKLVVVPVNFAKKAPKTKSARYYDDIVTWMWANVRDLLENKEVKLPDDSILVGEFSTRKYNFQSNGKQRLESKDELKKRGLTSPDRADAVALACMPVFKKK
ncbi:MAG: terminase B [Paenibacillaceae bacterium]|nr:terminase B [Paenibacillaceae bacterium]